MGILALWYRQFTPISTYCISIMENITPIMDNCYTKCYQLSFVCPEILAKICNYMNTNEKSSLGFQTKENLEHLRH